MGLAALTMRDMKPLTPIMVMAEACDSRVAQGGGGGGLAQRSEYFLNADDVVAASQCHSILFERINRQI